VKVTEVTPIGSLTLGGAVQIQSLGATYVKVNTTGKSGGLEMSFNLPASGTWNLDVLLVKDTGIEVLHPEGTTVRIPNVDEHEAVVFVPSSVSLDERIHDVSYTYRMDASITSWSDLVGDFDHNGTVGFEDFLIFTASFGQSAEIHEARCDIDADGRVDFNDFLVFANRFGESR
jgi:hypothetical protein